MMQLVIEENYDYFIIYLFKKEMQEDGETPTIEVTSVVNDGRSNSD